MHFLVLKLVAPNKSYRLSKLATKPVSCSFFLSSVMFDDFVKDFHGVKELTFAQLPFNHPLFIMFSSGTTGVPKCMVHSAGVRDLDKVYTVHKLYMYNGYDGRL